MKREHKIWRMVCIEEAIGKFLEEEGRSAPALRDLWIESWTTDMKREHNIAEDAQHAEDGLHGGDCKNSWT